MLCHMKDDCVQEDCLLCKGEEDNNEGVNAPRPHVCERVNCRIGEVNQKLNRIVIRLSRRKARIDKEKTKNVKQKTALGLNCPETKM